MDWRRLVVLQFSILLVVTTALNSAKDACVHSDGYLLYVEGYHVKFFRFALRNLPPPRSPAETREKPRRQHATTRKNLHPQFHNEVRFAYYLITRTPICGPLFLSPFLSRGIEAVWKKDRLLWEDCFSLIFHRVCRFVSEHIFPRWFIPEDDNPESPSYHRSSTVEQRDSHPRSRGYFILATSNSRWISPDRAGR